MKKNKALKAIYLIITIITFFAFNNKADSQWAIMREDADSLVRLGSFYIYNAQFDDASEQFNKVIDLYPNHPAGYFLDAMVEWWRISLNRRTEKFDKMFLYKIDRILDVCEKLLDSNAYDINALFFKGGALGYRGRFYVVRKKWLDATSDGKEAYDILNKCRKIAPGNHDVMLGTGIYNYFAEKLPEDYPLLQPLMLFLPRGDMRLGILQLQAASRYARYAATEAKVVLLQIYYEFEDNVEKALQTAEELYNDYPNNPYFQRYLGRCYVKNGDMWKMEQHWRKVLLQYMDDDPNYDMLTAREALYYIGYALQLRGEYDMALKYFYKCDEACRVLDKEPSGFMVQLNLRIGNIFDIQGKRKYAIKQYEKVLRMKEKQNSHAKAKKYIENPYR